jgi:integrating conjugative element protein (TIGR03759 family)
MDGPYGKFYSRGDANWFYVLGAESKTDEEALNYARKWINSMDVYHSNVARMMKLYDIASLEKYGENPRMFDIYEPNNNQAFNTGTASISRVKVYVDANECKQCDELVLDKVDEILSGKISGLDIYVLNTNKANTVIQRWAASIALPHALVKERAITLNHDDGLKKGAHLPSIEVTFAR